MNYLQTLKFENRLMLYVLLTVLVFAFSPFFTNIVFATAQCNVIAAASDGPSIPGYDECNINAEAGEHGTEVSVNYFGNYTGYGGAMVSFCAADADGGNALCESDTLSGEYSDEDSGDFSASAPEGSSWKGVSMAVSAWGGSNGCCAQIEGNISMGTGPDDGGPECPPGTTYNPETGECENVDPGGYTCDDGFICGGQPVTGTPNQTVCGTNAHYWTCTAPPSGPDGDWVMGGPCNCEAGQCGSAAGGTYTSAPSSGLCAAGTPSSVQDVSGGWSWTCSDLGGTASCIAYSQGDGGGGGGGTCSDGIQNQDETGVDTGGVCDDPPASNDGVCATPPDGGSYDSVDEIPGPICSQGTPSPSPLTGAGPWNWTCLGSGGGINDFCHANLGSGSNEDDPDIDIEVESTVIILGDSTEITWSSDVDSCVGINFDTGGTPSGTTTVTPASTMTYTIDCEGETAEVTVVVIKKPYYIEK